MNTRAAAGRPDGGHRATYEALQVIGFCVFPALLTLYALYYAVHFDVVGTDFQQEFWVASARVVHGLSPYDQGWMHISGGVSFPYPALTALVFVPLALLPHHFADMVFVIINIAAALATVWTLGVRDRRVYGVMLVWPVIVEAWQTANLTLVLALGMAWAWRKRDNPVIAGVLVAVMVSLKPFVWPLGLWLLVTRRYRAAAYALISGAAVNLVAWAVLGFDQLHRYNAVVNAVTNVMYRRGYDLAALGLHLGASHPVAYAVEIAVAGAAGLACVAFGRRGQEVRALVLCIALMLLATPVLWTHYFALLIIPVALCRPKLGPLWFLPLVLWACPINPAPWQAILALSIVAIMIVDCAWRPTFTAHDEPEHGAPVSGTPAPAAIPALVTE
jgi:hypothetical protein